MRVRRLNFEGRLAVGPPSLSAGEQFAILKPATWSLSLLRRAETTLQISPGRERLIWTRPLTTCLVAL